IPVDGLAVLVDGDPGQGLCRIAELSGDGCRQMRRCDMELTGERQHLRSRVRERGASDAARCVAIAIVQRTRGIDADHRQLPAARLLEDGREVGPDVEAVVPSIVDALEETRGGDASGEERIERGLMAAL